MFGDSSSRTKTISKHAISVMVAALIFMICIPWYLWGSHTYKQILARSSSPIGTQMTFNRSQADVKISDIYTDKKRNVLIARISVDTTAQAKLPYKGSDYKVYITSKSTNGLKSMPILFGRMSTDGDMFLVIPKPTDTVYSVFIQNKNFIGDGSLSASDKDTSGVADLSDNSIAAALSNYKYDDNSKSKSRGTYQIASDDNDTISFRLTINPASKDETFRPKVINADLLKKDGNSESFDFDAFFNKVFKESALKKMNEQYKVLSDNKVRLEKTLRDYQERYAENQNDTTAKAQIESLSSQIKDAENQLNELGDKISTYEDLKYDDSMFSNLQTKAKVITQK